MKCPVCGSEVDKNDKFCEVCGKALVKSEKPYRKIMAAAVILIGALAILLFALPEYDIIDYEQSATPVPTPTKTNVTATIPPSTTTPDSTMAKPEPKLKVSQLSFDPGTKGERKIKPFTISNVGTGTLIWSLNTDQPWIELSKRNGVDNGSIIVTVNSAYLSPGIHYGTIEVSSNGGVEKIPIEFTVISTTTIPTPQPPQLTTIKVSPVTASISVGNSLSFTSNALDQSDKPMPVAVSWSSNNTDVGTVDNNGFFTAIAPGTAIITASSGTVSGSAIVTVSQPVSVPTIITVSPINPSIETGDSQIFAATMLDQYGNTITGAVTWDSSDMSVGTIDATGLFKALTAGTTIIRAANGSVVGATTITVTSSITYIKYNVFRYLGLPVTCGFNAEGQKNCDTGAGYYAKAGEDIALDGDPMTLAKLTIEQTEIEKKTMVPGETWEIGDGWRLSVRSIDTKASPRQVWFVLIKDGIKVDEKIISEGKVYVYLDSNIPFFVTYVDSIFTGATTDLMQLKYTWAISR